MGFCRCFAPSCGRRPTDSDGDVVLCENAMLCTRISLIVTFIVIHSCTLP
jgi:hypothetical protein